jgi:hypothetical protein
LSLPKNGAKKKFHNLEKFIIPPKTLNLQISQSKSKTNTATMAEEVYEGAIGIDLGTFLLPAQMRRISRGRTLANFFPLIGTTYSCGTFSKRCAHQYMNT